MEPMIKIKMTNKLPRLITIPELDKDDYRKLQSGEVVEVGESIAYYLLDRGFVEIVDVEDTKTVEKIDSSEEE